jgi:NADP-dependent 3-hydroxy acid dehydrogenase YdfG
MSKFALEGLSQSIREEIREHRIRLINIYPAATNTEIWDDVAGDWPRKRMISPEQVADAVAFAITQPSDVLIENITLGKLEGNL